VWNFISVVPTRWRRRNARGAEFMGQMWLDDLKRVVNQLSFDYRMSDGKTLQDYCPRCKRIMRGLGFARR